MYCSPVGTNSSKDATKNHRTQIQTSISKSLAWILWLTKTSSYGSLKLIQIQLSLTTAQKYSISWSQLCLTICWYWQCRLWCLRSKPTILLSTINSKQSTKSTFTDNILLIYDLLPYFYIVLITLYINHPLNSNISFIRFSFASFFSSVLVSTVFWLLDEGVSTSVFGINTAISLESTNINPLTSYTILLLAAFIFSLSLRIFLKGSSSNSTITFSSEIDETMSFKKSRDIWLISSSFLPFLSCFLISTKSWIWRVSSNFNSYFCTITLKVAQCASKDYTDIT